MSNITDFRRSSPAIILGSVSNSYAIAGVTISSNAAAADGWVLVATGSNSAIWRNALAFGSNATDVSSVGTMGASSSNTRADHVHRGVASISHSSNTLYGSITLTTPGNTVAITSPTPGTLALAASASGGSGGSGPIVQVVTATSTTLDTTTVDSAMQNSSLSLAFAPQYADSILHITVDGECAAQRVAGTIAERYLWVGIYNSTNAVELVRQVRGRTAIATDADAALSFDAIALKGLYTVNSTAARTFVFQFMSSNNTNVQAIISGNRTGGVTMTIMEVRP